MYAQKEKSKDKKSRADANSVAQNSGVRQGFGFMDNRHAAIAQRKLQEISKSHSQNAHLNPIQKYSKTSDGKMYSSQKNLVLERDMSKEFYATDTGFKKNADALKRGKVSNIEFSKGETKKFEEVSDETFSKVTPRFKNIDRNEMKSETTLNDEREESASAIPAWYNPHWLWAKLVNINSGFRPRYFQEYLSSISDHKSKVQMNSQELKNREAKKNYMREAITTLNSILGMINKGSDDDIQDITKVMNAEASVLNVIQKSTLDYINFNWPKQSKKSIRDGLHIIVDKRKKEIEIELTDMSDSPYLPTDCGQMSRFLKGDEAENIKARDKKKPEVGDYYSIDYSKREDGPWPYHYATILFKDGADTVTLEDAAGQATSFEKDHWYFMMYGNKKTQSFKEKTDAEFDRRAKISKKMEKK